MTYETLKLTRDAAVATITLDRPDAFNALNMEMGRELRSASLALAADSTVRAVIVTGHGRAFCAGGDVAGFHAQLPDPSRRMQDLVLQMHDAVSVLTRMDAPVIAAINGPAAGAGLGLMMAADLAVAAQSAKFTMAYTGIGATPDASSTYSLPRLVGARRAMELVLLNRRLSAAEALDWGLINEVVADADLGARASALAQQLAAGPTLAFGQAKRLLRSSFNQNLEGQMLDEGRGIVSMTRTEDFAEGVTAFVEKRKPTFHGR